jgi:pSer/pThr/pTyr-binding forkhead associated (FHA) protein
LAIVIKFTQDDNVISEFPLFGEGITIGRSKKCDVVINDSKISGIHCLIKANTNGLIIFTDKGSTNGSFLDDYKLTTPHYLKLDEKIRIGQTFLFIDESKLTAVERVAIGRAEKKVLKESISLPKPTLTEIKEMQVPKNIQPILDLDKSSQIEANNSTNVKSSIQAAKTAKTKSKYSSNYKSDNEIDPDESSGNTKLLKIGTGIHKKKKKKN